LIKLRDSLDPARQLRRIQGRLRQQAACFFPAGARLVEIPTGMRVPIRLDSDIERLARWRLT
jgi:hypothetical protein